MNPAQIVALVVQVISAAQTLTPVALQAIADFEKLFADGAEPTQADVDALIAKINSQSEAIQAL